MPQTGKPLVRPPQQRLDPFVIHNVGAVDARLEHEALSINQDVALTPLYLLAPIEAAFFCARRGALYGLAIHHARAPALG
jgi:hypothetical protein